MISGACSITVEHFPRVVDVRQVTSQACRTGCIAGDRVALPQRTAAICLIALSAMAMAVAAGAGNQYPILPMPA